MVETHLREASAGADLELDAGRNFWLSFESVGDQAAPMPQAVNPGFAEPVEMVICGKEECHGSLLLKVAPTEDMPRPGTNATAKKKRAKKVK